MYLQYNSRPQLCITRFGRDQLANICRPYFLTLKKVVSSLLRFLWKQGELALVITPIFVWIFDFFVIFDSALQDCFFFCLTVFKH